MNKIVEKYRVEPFEIQVQHFEKDNEWRAILYNDSDRYGYIVYSGSDELKAKSTLKNKSVTELQEVFKQEETKHHNWINSL